MNPIMRDDLLGLAMYLAYRLRGLGSSICVQCGGRGAHRDDCPFNK